MRRKLLGFLGIAIIGFVLGAGAKLLLTLYPLVPDQTAQTATTQSQTYSNQESEALGSQDSSDSETTETQENSVSQEQPTEKTIIPEAKTDENEVVVEGMVDSVSTKSHTIRFTQEIDDTSKKVNPRVKVLSDAIVEINGKKSTFQQIMVGDYVTMILDSSRKARAIQIKR